MIACDVVLLPSPEAEKRALELNQALIEKGRHEIVLDKERCLPHITLAMGCIKEKDLTRVRGVLANIAASYPPVRMETVPSKEGNAWIRIEKTRDVELLHEIVMIRLSPFFSHGVTQDMIYTEEGEGISDPTLEYIRKFPVSSSFENYIPHITVGYGKMDIEVKSLKFVSGRLALCHLGELCTCRKVLSSYSLSGKP